jgi:hypothetical protein
MRTRQKLTILAALAVAAIAALWIARPWRSGDGAAAATPGAGVAGAGGSTAPAGSAPATGSAAALPADQAELVAYLRARFGAHIASRYVQIQMLEKLMRHFQAQDPAGWQAALLAALRAAFPERYAELAANLQHRLDYEEWLSRNRERLSGLGERERREALWEERKRLFGEEAAGEIWASERKGQALTDALAAIDAQPNATVGQRLEQYKESLLETHQEHADTYLQNHRQEALQRFLGLDSVQRELSALSPAERTAALRTVRKGLGLDAAALERWDTLDVERDRRWKVGLEYMAERGALAKQYSGEAFEARVQELRTRYFGAEAATIADEEASGFFRFDRPRQYGLN